MAAQELRQILRECRARQHHIASHLVGFLFEVALHMR